MTWKWEMDKNYSGPTDHFITLAAVGEGNEHEA